MSQHIQNFLRRGLLLVLVLGLVGTSADLWLLDHLEDWRQLLPLVVNGLTLVVLARLALGGGTRSVQLLRLLMVVTVALGLLGVWFHYEGNLEFQLEIDPSQGRWELFSQVMRAKAPPTLAPGTMVQLGLIGLLYTYRHPAIRRRH